MLFDLVCDRQFVIEQRGDRVNVLELVDKLLTKLSRLASCIETPSSYYGFRHAGGRYPARDPTSMPSDASAYMHLPGQILHMKHAIKRTPARVTRLISHLMKVQSV